MNVVTPITETEIASLVERFYAKVRLDPEIGPVFNDAVENWDAHLALLKDFWSTVVALYLTCRPRFVCFQQLACCTKPVDTAFNLSTAALNL